MYPATLEGMGWPSPKKVLFHYHRQARRLGESCRYLVRFPDYRATEPSLRAMDLQRLPLFCSRAGGTTTQRISLSVFGLSDRIQPQSHIPSRRSDGRDCPRVDRPDPRPPECEAAENDIRLKRQTELEAKQKTTSIGSRGRETSV